MINKGQREGVEDRRGRVGDRGPLVNRSTTKIYKLIRPVKIEKDTFTLTYRKLVVEG